MSDEPTSTATPFRVPMLVERASRTDVNQPATLRGQSTEVLDVLVENLSTTGCKITWDGFLDVGTQVTIGIPGLGMQAACIARSDNEGQALEFLLPLNQDDLHRTQTTQTVVAGQFPQMSRSGHPLMALAMDVQFDGLPASPTFLDRLRRLFR